MKFRRHVRSTAGKPALRPPGTSGQLPLYYWDSNDWDSYNGDNTGSIGATITPCHPLSDRWRVLPGLIWRRRTNWSATAANNSCIGFTLYPDRRDRLRAFFCLLLKQHLPRLQAPVVDPRCHRRPAEILLLHERRNFACDGTDDCFPVRSVDRCCLPTGPIPRLAKL